MSVRAAYVSDDGVAVGECDVVAGGDDVVDAHEGCAEAVGPGGGHLFDRFGFHVTVTDGGTGRGGAYVVLPNCPHEQAAG